MSIRKIFSIEEFVEGILAGNITILSRAITLAESKKAEDRELSSTLLDKILPYTGNSIRIGITGVPGVGKSTFIENFGTHLTANGNKIAVLAIDPTSQRTKGSILGDKTRMEKLSASPKAYIRPSAAGSILGGVASATREAMLLCEAAGFNIIIIETVGVGQSETMVKDMVDFFLLLMLAGAGDELQGIKRGIMEMADALIINKADGENVKAAKKAKAEYQTALHYMPPAPNQWQPKVLTCSALEDDGLRAVLELLEKFIDHVKIRGWFEASREKQNLLWFHEKIDFLIRESYYGNAEFKKHLPEYENLVKEKILSPASAALQLIATHKSMVN